MTITAFIRDEVLRPRLKKASVMAVYDPDRPYRAICQSMADTDTAVVDAGESSIEAREAAMLAFASLGRADHAKGLLVYVPAKPPVTDEARQADPFAVYAACGAVFPDGDGDGYESIYLKGALRRRAQAGMSQGPAQCVIDATELDDCTVAGTLDDATRSTRPFCNSIAQRH
jgi:hypothetical protein